MSPPRHPLRSVPRLLLISAALLTPLAAVPAAHAGPAPHPVAVPRTASQAASQAAAPCPQRPTLVNGGFEAPVVPTTSLHTLVPDASQPGPNTVPGWRTSASDHLIELWPVPPNPGGAAPAEGRQLAELNANHWSTLRQDLATTPGQQVYWRLTHRGAYGLDSMAVDIGPPASAGQQRLITDDKTAWGTYSGVYTVPAGQTTTRFAFRSVAAAGNVPNLGNLLDDVKLWTRPCAVVRSPQSPDDIRGVKWRGTQLTKGPNPLFSASFDTRGLPYSTAVGALAVNDIRTVVLRVANRTDLPPGTTLRQRDDEIIKMLRELNNAGINAYIWKRQWLQRNDRQGRAHYTGGANEFINDMSRLINRARSLRIDTTLQGVMPIETNVNSSGAVRERALYIARGINARTGGWLRTHTFMMPGAAMGSYFKGINQGGAGWLTAMRSQTGHFAFIYKHMESQPIQHNNLARLNPQWQRNVGYQARTTVGQQITFLRNTMGLADLEAYVRGNRARFPNHTHVVFWGDQGDGVAGTNELDNEPQWNYNTQRALHRLLVKTNHWHGYFYDFPFTHKGSTGQDLWRYLILVDRANNLQWDRNTALNRSKTRTVWDEWRNWPREDFTY